MVLRIFPENCLAESVTTTVWIGVKELCEKEGHDISSIRCIPIGGSAAPKSLLEVFEKKLAHIYGKTMSRILAFTFVTGER